MKSPLFVLVIILLGSLSFPKDQPEVLDIQQTFSTPLEQDAAFYRLSTWIEEHYAYSHCQYLWDQDDRIIQVRQGIGAVSHDQDGVRKFSYNMNIRVSRKQITVCYGNLKPIKGYRSRAAFPGLNPGNGEELEWIRSNLDLLTQDLEEMMN